MRPLYPLFCLAIVAGLATFARLHPPQGAQALPTDARSAWAIDLAHRLGNAQPSAETIALLVAWTKAEDVSDGAFARNNPINTTQAGYGEYETINGDGVKSYPDYEAGMAATVRTLTYAPYAEIVAGIQTNDPERALRGMYASPWGTDMRNVERLWRDTARVSSTACPLDPCWQSGTGYQDGHPGIDLGATLGQPVYAALAGVAQTSTTWPCGNGVMVTAGDWATLVCHLSAFAVADGATVASGAVIGYAGESGQAYGVHVHYERRYQGGNVNPLEGN